jgi:hypothetical protein
VRNRSLGLVVKGAMKAMIDYNEKYRNQLGCMQYEVTVICEDANFSKSYNVWAPSEGKAKSVAMLYATDGDLHPDGRLVECKVTVA